MRKSGGLFALAALCALSAGCVGKTVATASSGTGASSTETSTGSTNGSSAAASGTTSGSNSASSGGSGTSTGGISGSASSGTTTGRLPVFVDGGYVSCAAEVDTDGGEITERWLCPPGTYVCGDPGACAQCRSDDDCLNQDLPTFDPLRPHCDLDSGVPSYWGYCQQCVGDSDCADAGIDNRCNLNPNSAEPSIETQGFETCANLGPGCPYGTAAGVGGCERSPCLTDADCVGAISASPGLDVFAQEAEPYCISGACRPFPPTLPGYFCPNCSCSRDVACYDGISTCDESSDHCGCASSAQCGGPWPICELSDAGFVDDAGDLIGFCGCDTDADCGDAGLRCLDLEPNDESNLYGGKTCLFPCTDPRFPGCADLSPTTPVCDAPSGLCIGCETDAQCRTQASGSFVGPFCRLDGACGCQVDSDCSDHEVCGGTSSRSSAGGTIYECISPPLACTPASCEGACDWDSGTCATSSSGLSICSTNFDCAEGFCIPDAGECVQCRDDADCVTNGFAARSSGRCLGGLCISGCVSDADCTGNPNGSHCLSQRSSCGCGSDADCVTDLGGRTCDTDPSDPLFGSCTCLTSDECESESGGACIAPPGGGTSRCSSCGSDTDCASGFFCSPNRICRPRCDDGGVGCQAPLSFCDSSNVYGEDGNASSGVVPGAKWCYACLSGSDCPAGEACNGFGCASYCFGSGGCHPGQVCGYPYDTVCHASCDAGPCPTGQVCDLPNVVTPFPDLCYQCLGPADCPNGAGCNSETHTCGTCTGPSALGGPFECPPGAICSNYWTRSSQVAGVCLQNCDEVPCQDPGKTCAVFPDLTPYHHYCFGCLSDSDCADAGPGAWCDMSADITFTCRPPE